MTVTSARKELRNQADREKARFMAGFFRAFPGGYGEGDRFLGLTVPTVRAVARRARAMEHAGVLELLRSRYHEERLLALILLSEHYAKAGAPERDRIYRDYLKHRRYVNNWDLVDLSAPRIVGAHLFDKPRTPLYRLAKSRSLWDRRIAILATQHFIRQRDFTDTLRISRMLLEDEEDLIHKAVGWMLREVGNRSPAEEKRFLKSVYRRMPRTMLRYAIEKFPVRERKAYLQGTI